MVNVYIAADHAGWELQTHLIKELQKEGIILKNVGSKKFDSNDDYPDMAKKVAKAMQKDKLSFGILICGSGVGMCMAANRYAHIRAVHAHDTELAKIARLHNDANVLCMGARFIDKQKAKKVVMRFLFTPFSDEQRHKRRQQKLKRIKN